MKRMLLTVMAVIGLGTMARADIGDEPGEVPDDSVTLPYDDNGALDVAIGGEDDALLLPVSLDAQTTPDDLPVPSDAPEPQE